MSAGLMDRELVRRAHPEPKRDVLVRCRARDDRARTTREQVENAGPMTRPGRIAVDDQADRHRSRMKAAAPAVILVSNSDDVSEPESIETALRDLLAVAGHEVLVDVVGH